MYVGTYVRVYVCMYRPVHRMASIGLDRDTQFNLTLSMILSRCHLLFLLVQLQKVLAQNSSYRNSQKEPLLLKFSKVFRAVTAPKYNKTQ